MSHKQAKRLRKLKRMQEQQAQFSFQHLEQFIALSVLLTGMKPAIITVTDNFYNWFIQETQRHAETLGLKPGFKDDIPMFNGVKIEKKVSIHPASPVTPIVSVKN